MYSDRRPLRRFLLYLLIAFVIIYVIRQPDSAATAATQLFAWLVTVIDAFANFFTGLG
ncbi:hypothetical protein [Nonomuraea typhae]|uniref:hypothetical protein n=1 Tax=Nonomuraea typhae TaxID=2603600 RepID=UPI0012FB6CBD|nr:hypothetical protein [Nonomuraea typhae]